MTIGSKMATLFRGDVALRDLPKEALRRRQAAKRRAAEKSDLETLNSEPARLSERYRSMPAAELLRHFQSRPYVFFPFSDGDTPADVATALARYFPHESDRVTAAADQIANDRKWELAGFGAMTFDADNVWRADPLTRKDWGLEYHADVAVYRKGGADIRVLWELNRMGHLVTLALGFQLTGNERFAEAYFAHLESWMQQNPYGRGANWNCAMEAALRAINVLAAFDIFRRSAACTIDRLLSVLQFADQHGRFVLDNNEFSYVATSNHYLSDVVGLFWIGTMLPELEHAGEWREFGSGEMLREVEKQVLADGADFEASTGYHKFITEMLLYTHLLALRSGTELPPAFAGTVRRMLLYIGGIIRPDGRVPLIGDADGSQIVPIVRRDADDQEYLLALGTAVFEDSDLKEFAISSPEMFWLLGDKGIEDFVSVGRPRTGSRSMAFPDAGSYVMRDLDLYLHINTGDIGARGRGSHGHNDALSIEVSAGGRPFIVDPGSYVYNLDRLERQRFRSTAFHSTVAIDGVELNTTEPGTPFIMGNEASPKVLSWETGVDLDRIVAEHYGYKRLPQPVTHRRTVTFVRGGRYWIIEDELTGSGKHSLSFAFQFAPGIVAKSIGDRALRLSADENTTMLIGWTGITAEPVVRPSYFSRSYGHRETSAAVEWPVTVAVPFTARFFLLPVPRTEKDTAALALLRGLTDNIT